MAISSSMVSGWQARFCQTHLENRRFKFQLSVGHHPARAWTKKMPSAHPDEVLTARRRLLDWRPRWQQSGQEPDYRFTLANERTFLAWIRTALSVLAGAVLLVQSATRLELRALLIAISLGLALLAAVLSSMAYARWKANEMAMRDNKPLPTSLVVPVLAAATVTASVALMFLLIP